MAIRSGSGVSQYGNSELDFSTSQTRTPEIDVEGTTAINVTPNASVTQRSVGGGTQLSLSDGKVISLLGFSDATASLLS